MIAAVGHLQRPSWSAAILPLAPLNKVSCRTRHKFALTLKGAPQHTHITCITIIAYNTNSQRNKLSHWRRKNYLQVPKIKFSYCKANAWIWQLQNGFTQWQSGSRTF